MNYNHFRTPGQQVGESAFGYHSYDHEPFVPPLTLVSSGLARWFDNRSYTRRISDTFGIELITAGDARFVQDNKEYLVKAGEIYILRKGVSHFYGVGPSGFLHKRYVVMQGVLLESTLRACGLENCDHLAATDPGSLVNLFKQIHACMIRKPRGMVNQLSGLAYTLLLELGRSRAGQFPEPIRAAIEYMERNLDKPLISSQICRAAGLSQTHFNRLFRTHVGKPPLRFFFDQKMAWATHLLLQSAVPIKSIAQMLGYDDPLYFSSQFRKHTGLSPRAFRLRGSVTIDEGGWYGGA